MGKKSEFCCAIYMGKYGINVYSNDPGTFDILRKGSFLPFIPGYRCLKRRARSDYSIIYIRNTACSARVVGAKKLEIRAPLKDVVHASTIPFQAHFMLEPQMQKDSIFTSQGGGVSKKRQGGSADGKAGGWQNLRDAGSLQEIPLAARGERFGLGRIAGKRWLPFWWR